MVIFFGVGSVTSQTHKEVTKKRQNSNIKSFQISEQSLPQNQSALRTEKNLEESVTSLDKCKQMMRLPIIFRSVSIYILILPMKTRLCWIIKKTFSVTVAVLWVVFCQCFVSWFTSCSRQGKFKGKRLHSTQVFLNVIL